MCGASVYGRSSGAIECLHVHWSSVDFTFVAFNETSHCLRMRESWKPHRFSASHKKHRLEQPHLLTSGHCKAKPRRVVNSCGILYEEISS